MNPLTAYFLGIATVIALGLMLYIGMVIYLRFTHPSMSLPLHHREIPNCEQCGHVIHNGGRCMQPTGHRDFVDDMWCHCVSSLLGQ